MTASASRRIRRSYNYWPAFVDALSTLVMVVIFVLLVFMIAQYFLSSALSGRDAALERLTQQVNQLSSMLALERSENEELRASIAQLSAELQSSNAARDDLSGQLSALLDSKAELESALAEAQQNLVTNEQELAEAYQTIEADKETIEAQLAELALLKSLKDQLDEDLARLSAASAEKDRQIADLQAALEESQAQLAESEEELAASRRATGEGEEALAQQTQLTEEARRQVELLNAQLMALRQQLAGLMAALEAAEQKNLEQEVQIANLGQRLNEALATKVQELARYRSEFFGRMREILGDRRDIRIVGDRFVFQSEVLFRSGEAMLGAEGQAQLAALAESLKEIIPHIPEDIDWVLQVNGHTDKRPVVNSPYASNWELSQARALSVVRFLIAEGIPAEHLAAAGYAEFQPLDPSDSEEAYRANRRIEIKLTER